jgi:hypothetical protein
MGHYLECKAFPSLPLASLDLSPSCRKGLHVFVTPSSCPLQTQTSLRSDLTLLLPLQIAAYPADSTCVSMTPDVSTEWVDEEPLPEGRGMGNWIFLPDGRLVLINGIGKGTAGYGNTSWAIGQSFGDDPVHSCVLFSSEPSPSAHPADARYLRSSGSATSTTINPRDLAFPRSS